MFCGMQDFQKLLVWQRASALSLRIDVLLRQFPRREYVSLRAQLSRAADSIPANIVEGCGAATQREFARYLDIAIKSASETHHHLLAAADRKLIAPDDLGKSASLAGGFFVRSHTDRAPFILRATRRCPSGASAI